MSITTAKQSALFTALFLAFAFLPLPGPQAQKMDQIRGKIAVIDLGRNTLTLRTDASGEQSRDVAIWVEESTPLSNCGTGLYGNIGRLKAGDRVVVSYYEVNGTLYAISISPSGFALGDC